DDSSSVSRRAVFSPLPGGERERGFPALPLYIALELRVAKIKRIAVVGAGLGGLTAAGFLQRAGFAVKVYEQAPTFSRIGAGIILSANVSKVLRRLNLEEGLVAAGIKSRSYVSRAWDTGEVMAEFVFDAE